MRVHLTGCRVATKAVATASSEFWWSEQRRLCGTGRRLLVAERRCQHGAGDADRSSVCCRQLCDRVPGRYVQLLHARAAGLAGEHPIQRPAQQRSTLAAGDELCRTVVTVSKTSAVPCCLSRRWQDGKRHGCVLVLLLLLLYH